MFGHDYHNHDINISPFYDNKHEELGGDYMTNRCKVITLLRL